MSSKQQPIKNACWPLLHKDKENKLYGTLSMMTSFIWGFIWIELMLDNGLFRRFIKKGAPQWGMCLLIFVQRREVQSELLTGDACGDAC